jgi:hypothetical protein
MRYGLGYEGKFSLDEIGNKLGVSRERVRQIIEKALSRLRHIDSEWSRKQTQKKVDGDVVSPQSPSPGRGRRKSRRALALTNSRSPETKYPEITDQILKVNERISDEQLAEDIVEMQIYPQYASFLDFLRRLQMARYARCSSTFRSGESE